MSEADTELETQETKEALLKQTLLDALESRDYSAVNTAVDDLYPVDIAEYIEDMDDDTVLYLFRVISDPELAEVFEEADDETRIRIARLLDNYRIVFLFNYMAKDNVVDILGELPVYRKKDIVNLMRAGDRQVIQTLLGYDKNTAGGIMTTEYVSLNGYLSVAAAIEKVREVAPHIDVADTIFVVNTKREFIGTIDLQDLLSSKDDETLADIANTNILYVEPEMDQEEVALLVSRYDLSAIPVVNKRRGILGIITVDDVIDVINEEHAEDMLHMSGASIEETLDSSAVESVRWRLPWLLVNLITAFLAAFTVGLFENTIAQVVALAVAMPIVAGMGGNAGSQSLAITIRSIALGEADLRENWKLVFREAMTGIINGVILGVVTGAVLYIMYGNVYLGFIIFAAMIINLIIGGCFGFLIPLVLKKLKIDPALASSVVLTTATDVGGFFVFLGLAQLFLPLLT